VIPARRLFVGLALATLLVVVGIVIPAAAVVAVAADLALLVLAVSDAAAARRVPLEAARRWPAVLAQGSPAELVLELTNRGRRTIALRVREGLHPAIARAPHTAALRLPAGHAARLRVPLELTRRGEHRVLPLTVRVLGPLGLAWGQRELLPGEVRRVLPRVRWGGEVGLLLRLAQRRQLGRNPLRERGVAGEPYALREYLPGEPVRRIHWKATARHGRPIVREDSWERGTTLLLLLDAGRAMAAPAGGGPSTLDETLAAALAVLRIAAAREDRVTLVAFSDRIERVVRLRPGAAGATAAYRALYDLEPRLAEPAFELAVERALELERRSGVALLLTSMTDLAAAEGLRGVLLRLGRRHRTVLVNLEDPGIERLALGAPASPPEAFAKAAALEVLLANRRTARALAARGIRVVSTTPRRLASEAIRGYLDAVVAATPRTPAGSRRAAATPARAGRVARPVPGLTAPARARARGRA